MSKAQCQGFIKQPRTRTIKLARGGVAPAQDAAVNQLLGAGQVQAAASYAVLLGSASSVAVR